jgi:hypothetical protein
MNRDLEKRAEQRAKALEVARESLDAFTRLEGRRRA